jgi:hypothetical protein
MLSCLDSSDWCWRARHGIYRGRRRRETALVAQRAALVLDLRVGRSGRVALDIFRKGSSALRCLPRRQLYDRTRKGPDPEARLLPLPALELAGAVEAAKVGVDGAGVRLGAELLCRTGCG